MNVREWALPVYTILMQLAVGALFVLWLIRAFVKSKFSSEQLDHIIRNPMLVISFTVVVAMFGAHFHLSKPFHSFFAFRNFQTSWLSREITFTVLFFLALGVLWLLSRFRYEQSRLITVLGWTAILFGVIVIYCMACIYLLPTQVAWNSPTVIVSFYTTAFLLGTTTIVCLLVMDLKFAEIQKTDDVETRVQVIKYSIVWLTLAVFTFVMLSIGVTLYQLNFLGHGDATAQTSLQLLLELYMPLFVARLFFLSIAPLWLGYAVRRMFKFGSAPQSLFMPVYMSCLLILVGEILGRFLFYATHIRVGV